MELLVDELVDDLGRGVAGPFALFGHCSGALVAFELARALRRRGRDGPAHLAVASQPAPRLSLAPVEDADVWHLVQRGGRVDETVAGDAEVRDLLRPAIAADLRLTAEYRYVHEEPLAVPLTVFAGTADSTVGADALRAWQEETRGPFALTVLHGDHFFRDRSWSVLGRAVGEAVRP
jgi:medium-chain acyl-[acyl-carrier-protein] hydrolase